MTDPTPTQEDLTADDSNVRQTDNGWHEGDGPQPVQTGEPALGTFTAVSTLADPAEGR